MHGMMMLLLLMIYSDNSILLINYLLLSNGSLLHLEKMALSLLLRQAKALVELPIAPLAQYQNFSKELLLGSQAMLIRKYNNSAQLANLTKLEMNLQVTRLAQVLLYHHFHQRTTLYHLTAQLVKMELPLLAKILKINQAML
jgi:hypothetical protein